MARWAPVRRQIAEWVPGAGAADQMRVAGTWRIPEMELWDRESIELMGRLYRVRPRRNGLIPVQLSMPPGRDWV